MAIVQFKLKWNGVLKCKSKYAVVYQLHKEMTATYSHAYKS